jgi:hypothetical protein
MPAVGSILYKSYIVRQDGGSEILCDPYVVRKDDYLIKLFRQRGEIAEKDFPAFLDVFKRLNPHIQDIDKIRPGQHIYIPLKQLAHDTLLDQDSGVVTIPFVTISNIHEFIKKYAVEHEVQHGEFVSRLIARGFGDYGTRPYEQGVELFKVLNPKISDPNRIFPGQTIRLPDPSLRDQPWYASLFDDAGRISEKSTPAENLPPKVTQPGIAAKKDPAPEKKTPMGALANLLDGRLLERGVYYFPRKGVGDLKLDLSQSPIVELKDGVRMLFLKNNLSADDRSLIESYWKDTSLVPVPAGGSMEDVFDAAFGKMGIEKKNHVSFSDRGLEVEVKARWIISRPSGQPGRNRYICVNLIENRSERTPDAVSEYLKKRDIIVEDIFDKKGKKKITPEAFTEEKATEDLIPIQPTTPRAFVRDLLMSLGVRYAENVKISFPYVGIQVEATTNLISTFGRGDVVVDFEDLYGDAARAIKKTGLAVVQIKREDTLRRVVEKLLAAMKDHYTIDPTFYASKRSTAFNTALKIPGFLLEKEGYPNKTLLAEVPLNEGVVTFLRKRGVNIIMIKTPDEEKRIG